MQEQPEPTRQLKLSAVLEQFHDAVALTHHAVNAGWISVEETPDVYPDAPEHPEDTEQYDDPGQSGTRALPAALQAAGYPLGLSTARGG